MPARDSRRSNCFLGETEGELSARDGRIFVGKTDEERMNVEKENQNRLNEEDESAAVIKAGFSSKEYDARDIALDVLGFFLTAGVAFGWMMLMLLIISFVSLSYLHFDIKVMILISLAFALIVMVVYVVKKIKKYRLLRARESERAKESTRS